MGTLSCASINDTTGTCATLEGTGVGLAIFFQYMLTWIGGLLIVLGLITAIVYIVMAIGRRIESSVGHKR